MRHNLRKKKKMIKNIHNPERLPGETQLTYRHRQKVSRALAGHGMLISRKSEATAQQKAKRALVEKIGARQARKLARLWRALDKLAAAGLSGPKEV